MSGGFDKEVNNIYKCIRGSEFDTIVTEVHSSDFDFTITSVRELGKYMDLATDIVTNIRTMLSCDMRDIIRILLIHAAITDFVNTTPFRGSALCEAYECLDTIDYIYSIGNHIKIK